MLLDYAAVVRKTPVPGAHRAPSACRRLAREPAIGEVLALLIGNRARQRPSQTRPT